MGAHEFYWRDLNSSQLVRPYNLNRMGRNCYSDYGRGRTAKEKTTIGERFDPESHCMIVCPYGHGSGRLLDNVREVGVRDGGGFLAKKQEKSSIPDRIPKGGASSRQGQNF